MSFLRTVATITAALGTAATANAAETKLLASTAIRSALQELAPQFEKATGNKLVITYGASLRLQQTIEKGEAFDLAILSTAVVDALAKQGKLVVATRVDVARSGAGVAVRRGSPRPDVSTPEAVKRALLSANSIGYSDTGAASQFLSGMFEKLGIAAEVKPKLKLARPDQPSLVALANGDIDLAIPQISEALETSGVDLAGPLPTSLQTYTVLPAAVGTNAANPADAKALLNFLATPAALSVLRAKGLEPG
jgi:molybdate transport system substrate-binding protein